MTNKQIGFLTMIGGMIAALAAVVALLVSLLSRPQPTPQFQIITAPKDASDHSIFQQAPTKPLLTPIPFNGSDTDRVVEGVRMANAISDRPLTSVVSAERAYDPREKARLYRAAEEVVAAMRASEGSRLYLTAVQRSSLVQAVDANDNKPVIILVDGERAFVGRNADGTLVATTEAALRPRPASGTSDVMEGFR